MRHALRATFASPWVASALIGALMLVARFAPRADIAISPWIAGLTLLLSVLLAFVSGFLAAGPERSLSRAALVAATPAILVAAGFGLYLTIDAPGERTAAAVATVGFVAAYVSYAKGIADGAGGFTDADFAHVSAAVHVVAVFLAFAFALSVADYLAVPMWAVALVVAATLALVSVETLRRAGLEQRASGVVLTACALAVLGVELFVGASFLPTSFLVSAGAAAIVFSAVLHAAMDVLSGRASEKAMRRQFFLALGLLVVLFATARWA